MTPEHLRGVLTNNIDRVHDIIWDLTNKPEFNKSDPNVLGVIAVAETILVSLTALLVDCDPAGRVDRDQRASEEDWRSIETAPKSVVPILLTDARIQDFTAVCWYEVDESYPWQTYDGIGYHETRFTHWKPLPAPPSQSTAQVDRDQRTSEGGDAS